MPCGPDDGWGGLDHPYHPLRMADGGSPWTHRSFSGICLPFFVESGAKEVFSSESVNLAGSARKVRAGEDIL